MPLPASGSLPPLRPHHPQPFQQPDPEMPPLEDVEIQAHPGVRQGPARKTRCEALRISVPAAAHNCWQVTLRAGTGTMAGLAAGSALGSLLTYGALSEVAGPWTNNLGAVVVSAVHVPIAVAAGMRAGTLVDRTLTGGRFFPLALLLGPVIGGMPFAVAYSTAAKAAQRQGAPNAQAPGPQTPGPQTAQEAVEDAYVRSACGIARRYWAAIGRDTFNKFVFDPFTGALEMRDAFGRKLDPELVKQLDKVKVGLAQVGYTVSSYFHLTQLRGALTEKFGFPPGLEFLELFTNTFGSINSSAINEMWDDFQVPWIQVLMTVALGYALHYNPKKFDGIKDFDDFMKKLRLGLDGAAVRITGFGLADCVMTLAQTYGEDSPEYAVLMITAAFLVGLTEWRGYFVRKGQVGETPDEAVPPEEPLEVPVPPELAPEEAVPPQEAPEQAVPPGAVIIEFANLDAGVAQLDDALRYLPRTTGALAPLGEVVDGVRDRVSQGREGGYMGHLARHIGPEQWPVGPTGGDVATEDNVVLNFHA